MPYTDSGMWVPPKGIEQCTWVSDGQAVIAPYKGSTGIHCHVQIAAGNHACVVVVLEPSNEKKKEIIEELSARRTWDHAIIDGKHHFTKWFDVLDLYRATPTEGITEAETAVR